MLTGEMLPNTPGPNLTPWSAPRVTVATNSAAFSDQVCDWLDIGPPPQRFVCALCERPPSRLVIRTRATSMVRPPGDHASGLRSYEPGGLTEADTYSFPSPEAIA
jgi:hypothetical protein